MGGGQTGEQGESFFRSCPFGVSLFVCFGCFCVLVEGKLGSKVNFFGRQDEGALVLKHCSTGGTWL